MKKRCFGIFLLFFLLSCARNDKNAGSGISVAPRVKRQIMSIATDYVKEKFKESKKTVAKDGIVTIVDNQIKYVIDPAKILVGLIDDDTNEDAIVSIDSYNGQYLVTTEHLILLKKDSKFIMNRAIESEMKIMGLKDRIITVEISTIARDSPLYGCEACKEIIKYQFREGNLVKTE